MRRTQRWILVIALAGCNQPRSRLPDAASRPPDAARAAAAVPPSRGIETLPGVIDLAPELEAARLAHELPAVAAAVWRDGQLIAIGAVGVRKAGDPASVVTIDDRWHLGSNTKAMTAALIGIHVDRGTLRWSDPIAKLFAGETIDPGYAAVTLDQLVRHVGGLPAAIDGAPWARLIADGPAPDARATFVRDVLARPPAQAPGTFAYSNGSYMVAAAALERATRRRWDELLVAEIFTPLGMTSCGFGAPGHVTPIDQPWGHDDGDPLAPGPEADNPPGLGPAGTVHCGLRDYGKFLALQLDDDATALPSLSPATRRHLRTSDTPYAGGWMVGQRGGRTLLAHSGSNTLWYLSAVLIREPRVAIVVATNQGADEIEELLKPLAKRFAPAPAP